MKGTGMCVALLLCALGAGACKRKIGRAHV